jgi:hypothetical protein
VPKNPEAVADEASVRLALACLVQAIRSNAAGVARYTAERALIRAVEACA